MATSKSQFISRVSDVVVQMAVLQETCTGLAEVFAAREYYTGGTNAIVQDDLDNAGMQMTATQFNEVAVVIGDYLDFCNNVAVAADDRKRKLNIARKDI